MSQLDMQQERDIVDKSKERDIGAHLFPCRADFASTTRPLIDQFPLPVPPFARAHAVELFPPFFLPADSDYAVLIRPID